MLSHFTLGFFSLALVFALIFGFTGAGIFAIIGGFANTGVWTFWVSIILAIPAYFLTIRAMYGTK